MLSMSRSYTNHANKACPLSVIAPTLGVHSETFIHRHMTALLPGRTAVVVRNLKNVPPDFDRQLPLLVLGNSKRYMQRFSLALQYRLGLNKFSPVETLLQRYLEQLEVKVILSEYLDESLKWLKIAKSLGVRFFAHAHGYDVSITLRDVEMCKRYMQLEEADGIITVSEYSKDKLVTLGLSADKIIVIPCGVEVHGTPPNRANRDSEVRCLVVGRMVAKKAPLITLEAFRNALIINPKLHLDYVGSGELSEKAEDFVRKYNLGESITFHNNQPNNVVRDLMSKADIFIQHSLTDPKTGDQEGLPVAILEAMASALPVVATRHAGIPEAVLNGVSGYLVDEGDITGMAENVAALSFDRNLIVELGQAGWNLARQKFSWERERSDLLTLMKVE